MSLFDRITQTLDNWLSAPAPEHPAEEEQGHMALLEQSSDRIRATVDAIRQGNLIAASSTTEDIRSRDLMRYEQLRATAPQPNMTHVERLTAARAAAAQSTEHTR